MKIAISQPTYLPWLGYLDLIDQVDTFVFLDTVQFEKRSWQQRNRIKTQNGLSLLTVPVAVKGRFDQKIKDAEIESSHFVRKHLRSLELNYHRCPFFAQFFPELAQMLQSHSRPSHLADLNIQLIRWLCHKLGITTVMLRSSQMDHEGRRSDLLLNLCRTLNADCYVSSLGAAKYLLPDLSRFSAAGIDVIFRQYDHPRYRQRFPPFVSHASIIDLLFNEGNRSLEILRTGRQPTLLPSPPPSYQTDWVVG
jgi:hypothetical protein